MKKIIVILALTGLAACGTVKLITPSQTDVDRLTTKYPGLTLADLQQGKTMFEGDCGKCHSLKRPFLVSEPALEKVMPKMAEKAHIDSKSSDQILKYLLAARSANSKKQ